MAKALAESLPSIALGPPENPPSLPYSLSIGVKVLGCGNRSKIFQDQSTSLVTLRSPPRSQGGRPLEECPPLLKYLNRLESFGGMDLAEQERRLRVKDSYFSDWRERKI